MPCPPFSSSAFWLALQSGIVDSLLISGLPASVQALSEGQLNLLLSDIRNLAAGDITSKTPDPMVLAAAERYNDLRSTGFRRNGGRRVSLLASPASLIGWRAINPSFRARPRVENASSTGC